MGFMTLHGGQSIVKVVEKQLSDYHYTYPVSGHVSAVLLAGHSSIFVS
jgi:hypothetical protein